MGANRGAGGRRNHGLGLERGALIGAVLIGAAALGGAQAQAAQATQSLFGTLPDGTPVPAVTLTNHRGMTVRLLALGATIQSVQVPDRQGRLADVVLGFDDIVGYEHAPGFMGATIGRYANRIANARFSLDGKTYQLTTNDGPNAMHGGRHGFDKAVWTVAEARSGAEASVTFRLVSPDGDQGFPGTLTATVTYALDEHDDFSVRYAATTDAPTVVNLSNHSYWDLAGEGAPQSALAELLTVPADHITPVGKNHIPTGELRPVAGTAFDFTKPKPIWRDIRDAHDPQLIIGHGYDEDWVQSPAPVAAPRLMARLADPASGRMMELWSDRPAIQVYSGNFYDGTVMGKAGHLYRAGDGVALEAQIPPDAPNQPALGSARLDPGQTYRSTVIYKFRAQ